MEKAEKESESEEPAKGFSAKMKRMMSHSMSLLIAIFIAMIELAIEFVITWLVELEQPDSYSEEQMTIAEYLWKVNPL